jgi:hypothetical protein
MTFRLFAAAAALVALTSCASLPNATTTQTLVGAWEVTANRARGVGKNLLTFSSDQTFFRSGDTHPVVSGGHGAWKLVGPKQYQASYVSFTFDRAGTWVGINRNNLQLTLSPDGNAFTGTVKSSTRDLQDNEISTGSSPLAGKRIQVQPF